MRLPGGQEGRTSALKITPSPITLCHGPRDRNDKCGPPRTPEFLMKSRLLAPRWGLDTGQASGHHDSSDFTLSVERSRQCSHCQSRAAPSTFKLVTPDAPLHRPPRPLSAQEPSAAVAGDCPGQRRAGAQDPRQTAQVHGPVLRGGPQHPRPSGHAVPSSELRERHPRPRASAPAPPWGSLQPQPSTERLAPRIRSPGGGPSHLCANEPSRRRSRARTSENSVNSLRRDTCQP